MFRSDLTHTVVWKKDNGRPLSIHEEITRKLLHGT